MSWAIGYDDNWQRDIGYGVPAICDHPACRKAIHRGLAYVCGAEPYGGDDGCGLFFCGKHLIIGAKGKEHQVCERCAKGAPPFTPKPDVPAWLRHKLKDPTWKPWRDDHPVDVAAMRKAMKAEALSARLSAPNPQKS